MQMDKYTRFNNLIWENKELKSNEKYILIYLISYHNQKLNYAYPTYKQIQKDTGISRNTLAKVLKGLEEKGYIFKKIHITKTGRNNIYYINKYLVLLNNDNDTLSEASTGSEALSKNVKLIQDNAKLSHNLNAEQVEQVNQLEYERLNQAIAQANKYSNRYSLNYILAIYKNGTVHIAEEQHKDSKGQVVKGAYQQKFNDKAVNTRYHNSFNEHYKNYSYEELEQKLLEKQAKKRREII